MAKGKKQTGEDKKTSFKKLLQPDQNMNKVVDFFWRYRIELFSSVLLVIGIILSFYYHRIGGILVGLAVGICFFDEIYNYLMQLRGYYTTQGLFKTLMFIGLVVYFLIAIPAFVVFAAIGFGVMFLIRWFFRKKS